MFLPFLHVFRSARCRAFVISFTLLLTMALAGFTGSGCGSSGRDGKSAAGSLSGAAALIGTGRAAFTVEWPQPTQSRLIPRAASAIRVTLLRDNSVVTEQLLTRPAVGGTSTAQFDQLPEGVLRVEANTYPNADGSGVILSRASGTVSIVLEEIAAVRLSLISTIDHLTITPPADGLAVGRTGQATVAAYDAAGALIPLAPDALNWSANNPSIATVDATGLLTGVAAGSATIQVSDQESQKTASYAVTVNPAPRPTRWFAYFVSPFGDGSFPGVDFPIRQYAVADDGTMTPLSPPAVSGGRYGYKVFPHPLQPFVYVVNVGDSSGNSSISQFRLQSNGQLTPLNPPVVSLEPYRFPQDLVFTPDGTFAYINVLNYVCQLRVNADGTLAPLEPFVAKAYDGNNDSTALAIHPSGGAVFNKAGGGFTALRRSSNGQLTAIKTPRPIWAYEEKLVVPPVGQASGQFVYSYGGPNMRSISQYAFSGDGTIAPLSPNTISLPVAANSVVFEPSGNFAFVTAHDMPFQTFRLAANGQLENRFASIPGTTHRGFFSAVHPGLPYLYAQPAYIYSGEKQAGDPDEGTLTRFRINADGSLTPLSPAIASSARGRGPFFVPSYAP